MCHAVRSTLVILYVTCQTYFCQAQETKEIKIQWDTNHDWQKHSLLRPITDSTVFEMIVGGLRNGSLMSYSYLDDVMTEPLSLAELNNIFKEKRDTIFMEDPITGEQVTKIYINEFRYSSVVKYRLQTSTKNSNSQSKSKHRIITITPVLDEYAESGEYIGEKPLLKIRYEDVLPIIQRYEHRYPDNTLAPHLPK